MRIYEKEYSPMMQGPTLSSLDGEVELLKEEEDPCEAGDAGRPTNLGVGGQEAGQGGFFTRMFRLDVTKIDTLTESGAVFKVVQNTFN